MKLNNVDFETYFKNYPNEQGYFGRYGGSYIAENLQKAMEEITEAYITICKSRRFISELRRIRKEFQGRPTPISYLERLSGSLGNVQLYVKREDLNHTGAHKLNHCMGEALLAKVAGLVADTADNAADEAKAKIRTILGKLPLANLTTEGLGVGLTKEFFDRPEWASLSESCLGCGTCTFHCPTCQCYDVRDFDTGHGIKRFRCWDSCMYSDFTKMAHGNPRVSQLERFRQRFMHKLVYFPDNNDGIFGCVGCGRCLSKCPISMNIVKVMKVLAKGGNK